MAGSETILAEQGGRSGNGHRYPILFFVKKGQQERRVNGVLHARTTRKLRDGTAVFEPITEPKETP